MYFNTFVISDDDYLMHYGVKRRSGRYPWGSGDNPFQHSGDFLSRVEQMKKEGFTYTDDDGKTYSGETAIAKSFGYSTTQLRTLLSIAKSDRRQVLVTQAKDLRAKGYSLDEIAKQMGYSNDSSVRSLLNADSETRMLAAKATYNHLKEQCDSKGILEVGKGVERELGVSRDKFEQALEMLRFEGYEVYGVGVQQATNKGQQTTTTLLCPPGTEYKDAYAATKSLDGVHSLHEYTSPDGGDTFEKTWVYPKSMDSKRLDICYAEDGGLAKDGLIEIRRNVDDLNLGYSKYAQVRILVDDSRYIKGMAVYSDDLPDGIDVRFNTNKSKSVDKMDVLKKIKDDPTNPFGSLIKDGVDDPDFGEHGGGQSYYYDKNGKKQLSLINKRAEEGDWDEWANKLSSQFLSKQSTTLIKKQLGIEMDNQKEEYDKICQLTNPTVKRKLLESFANDCDSAAVHLKAAALPRQHYQVILPLTSIKDNEIYAPNYKNGETVALVRYPHGGTFEIPILKVNNKLAEGKSVMGTDPKDAVGISAKVAAGLSGADFDGDTVMVIPCNDANNKTRITSTYDKRSTDPALKSLEDFDAKMSYGPAKFTETKVNGKTVEHAYRDDGTEYKLMSKELTQKEMGKVSNLITDMTLKGAPTSDIAKAVKHSMVVIDANKHHLDYKQSEIDNDIATLKNRWQGHYKENGNWSTGAGTLISRASAQQEVFKRQGSPRTNIKGKSWYNESRPEGALIYKTADDLTYVDKNGKTKYRTQKSTQMAETDDARTLSTGHPVEELYANYANTMKDMANKARLESAKTGRLEYSTSANKTYSEEVASLKAKLNQVELNKPRERMANVEANAIVAAKQKANPDMTKKEIKKASQVALTAARKKFGVERTTVDITQKEWNAIQAGAISDSNLKKLLDKADLDTIRSYATPKSATTLTSGQRARIRSMAANGYTQAEIAAQMGISTSTVSKYTS